MSSYALALDASQSGRQPRKTYDLRRTSRAATLPWASIPLAHAHGLRSVDGKPAGSYLWVFIAAAIAIHGAVIWHATHFVVTAPSRPTKHEVAVELVRPPKPLEPKIEPPKPVKTQPRQPAKVLPPIQTAVPEPSTISDEVATKPVAIAPVATASLEPVVEKVTDPVGHAGYLNNPPPEYPAVAVRQRWQGTVLLRVHVLSDGHVESVEVHESSGRRVLDDQAIRTVKNWLFTPSRRGETSIDGWATVPIEFRLDS